MIYSEILNKNLTLTVLFSGLHFALQKCEGLPMGHDSDVIFFRCPECGEEMEINARREGEEVRCVECGEMVLVRSQAPRRSGRSVRRREDPGLSSGEWWMFAILFFFIPAVNVFASSILYYIWKADKPRRAGQINMLGFLVFGIHILLFVGLFILIIMISPPGPPRRQF